MNCRKSGHILRYSRSWSGNSREARSKVMDGMILKILNPLKKQKKRQKEKYCPPCRTSLQGGQCIRLFISLVTFAYSNYAMTFFLIRYAQMQPDTARTRRRVSALKLSPVLGIIDFSAVTSSESLTIFTSFTVLSRNTKVIHWMNWRPVKEPIKLFRR